MNVDEYKAKHGEHPLSGFKNIAHTPAVPVNLHALVDDTIRKIEQIYVPFAWSWVKSENKDTWRELLEIEESINVAIQGENEEYLKEALRKYYEMWVIIIEAFEPVKDEFVPF